MDKNEEIFFKNDNRTLFLLLLVNRFVNGFHVHRQEYRHTVAINVVRNRPKLSWTELNNVLIKTFKYKGEIIDDVVSWSTFVARKINKPITEQVCALCCPNVSRINAVSCELKNVILNSQSADSKIDVIFVKIQQLFKQVYVCTPMYKSNYYFESYKVNTIV